MNDFAMSCEIAYRHEQLHRLVTRPRSARSARQSRWRSIGRTPKTTPADGGWSAAAPAVGSIEFRDWVGEVGHRLAEHGVAAVRRQLAELNELAKRHGVAAVSRSVLADRRAPEVARARAFQRVATALQQLTPEVSTTSDLAA